MLNLIANILWFVIIFDLLFVAAMLAAYLIRSWLGGGQDAEIRNEEELDDAGRYFSELEEAHAHAPARYRERIEAPLTRNLEDGTRVDRYADGTELRWSRDGRQLLSFDQAFEPKEVWQARERRRQGRRKR